MAKSTKKRTVTCGKCKKTGHNARSCTITEDAPVAPAPTVQPKPPEAKRRMSKVPKRESPTADRASAAPYRCNKCNNVAILVAVKIKDYDQSFKQKKEVFKSDLRCEKCMNKPSPSDLILKWGAVPDEVVPVPGQDDA
jgi:hypothetical protein